MGFFLHADPGGWVPTVVAVGAISIRLFASAPNCTHCFGPNGRTVRWKQASVIHDLGSVLACSSGSIVAAAQQLV